MVNVPWQRQIGPSCGLAALRMVRDYFFAALEGEAASKLAQMPSLMREAKERGYAPPTPTATWRDVIHDSPMTPP